MTTSTNPIRVVLMARESYGLRLAAAVRSLIDHLGADRTLEIALLEDDLSSETRKRLLDSWDLGRTTVEWVDVGVQGQSAFPTSSSLLPIYFARLEVARHLPSWDRAILLDPDVLVLVDIGKLWDLELGDHLLLATRDPWITSVSHPDGVIAWREAGLSADAPYFNAAVLLANLGRLRRENFIQQAIDFCGRFPNDIVWGEQDILNALLENQWGELDPRWQVHPRILNRPRLAPPYLTPGVLEQMRSDPWIYHYGGRLKPWDYRSPALADERFYEVLDRTLWRGWRPPRSLRSALYRLYDSPLRNWLHPLEVRTRAWLRRRAQRG